MIINENSRLFTFKEKKEIVIDMRYMRDFWGEDHVPFLSVSIIVFYAAAHSYFMHSSVCRISQ